jgi:hypothetical protein
MFRTCYVVQEAATRSMLTEAGSVQYSAPGDMPAARKLLPAVKGTGQLESGKAVAGDKTTHDVRRRGFWPSGRGEWPTLLAA